MRSENKNFLYTAIYQLLVFLFPLITIPYVSRVLGVDGIGIYSYTYSIVYLFMLFAMLGINNYGNREIAKVRDNKIELSRRFITIYILQLCGSLLSIVAYVVYLYLFCNDFKQIAKIQILFLISCCFDVNWFYFGLELFKKAIIRNLVLRISSLICIFVFVKSSADLWLYSLILSGATLLSQIYLFSSLPKYIRLVKIEYKEVVKHIKGVVILFIPVLAFGIYRVLDKTMLGILSSVTELGFFENSERLINIPIAIIGALGTVMLPTMSYHFTNKSENASYIIENSMKLAMILSTMMCAGLMLISYDATIVLFGTDFYRCGDIIIFLAITVVVSAWSNVIRTQYLIPKSLDSIYIFSTIGGAVVNFVINILTLRTFGAYGACFGTIMAELFVVGYQFLVLRNVLPVLKYIYIMLLSLVKAFLIVGLAYISTMNINDSVVSLLAKIAISIILFCFVYLSFIKDFFGINK